ncbi:MAG: CDP-glucose 4,6-dehydratase [Rhizobiales bacterium 24-66-13]|nr:MAG: CDP-glucose 4,6-dehydratase [Rhizobiales bacterium 12-66-7]OYY88003.1 MAG: CDP-glucose 4,6-dehydratase [Rhizobiales bacterium 35-66-30]OYZ82406.1 MAG: CDP-glucose 4,6-dehydratase [Rhizobiales bacterium 24-66-13]OZB08866.1 MAG: CDP-glucose 4,6-dehydratase [Rhizobiales bacterium 39-66-18]
MVMNAQFWSGRRVLVTGHTGFKGSWLVLWLNALGARVCGYALPPATQPSLFEAIDGDGLCTSRLGDIRDAELFNRVVQDFQPEIILHLAAQAVVRVSYLDPVETYSTNLMGLVNVFEALRRCPSVRAIVNVTSDKCYENNEWVWAYRESDPMGGYDPYSSSKGCAELITSAYRRSFFAGNGVNLASARAGNVIGGGDWTSDRLIPDFIRSIAASEELVLRMPRATRPWQHVLEPLSGYLALAEALCETGESAASSYNFGPSDDSIKSVEWIARRICEIWGDSASWRVVENADLHEAQNLRLESAKARHQLRWSPRWPLEEALVRVVEWHRAFNEGQSMREFTLQQIEAYQQAR